ncbi:MAG: glucose-1-phosphate thymidylyltransferase [Euryarchaeota archaeon]|nr:glucose-1-phosphate thymidylyltransferase [Euryarchaeota archaeon]|tara:strand:+ start:5525 stop:6412 length:888 start_codon:yes stop_codon:yes gene_type:complete
MSKNFKGIILAGGFGTRLKPLTNTISKQLMPVYDKPMIYYPLSTLMLTGIKDILIITTSKDESLFKNLLGNGERLGISISYKVQNYPNGIAEAFLIAEDFIKESNISLILGDNLFAGSDLINILKYAKNNLSGAHIFASIVNNPKSYGVVKFDKFRKIVDIIEKPLEAPSKYAVTGIYFFDSSVIKKTKLLKPSNRNELEITDLLKLYLKEDKLDFSILGRGITWLDTGTFESLHDASSFVKTIENRQGLKLGCPEEIAWRNRWINNSQLKAFSSENLKSGYGEYLLSLLDEKIF